MSHRICILCKRANSPDAKFCDQCSMTLLQAKSASPEIGIEQLRSIFAPSTASNGANQRDAPTPLSNQRDGTTPQSSMTAGPRVRPPFPFEHRNAPRDDRERETNEAGAAPKIAATSDVNSADAAPDHAPATSHDDRAPELITAAEASEFHAAPEMASGSESRNFAHWAVLVLCSSVLGIYAYSVYHDWDSSTPVVEETASALQPADPQTGATLPATIDATGSTLPPVQEKSADAKTDDATQASSTQLASPNGTTPTDALPAVGAQSVATTQPPEDQPPTARLPVAEQPAAPSNSAPSRSTASRVRTTPLPASAQDRSRDVVPSGTTKRAGTNQVAVKRGGAADRNAAATSSRRSAANVPARGATPPMTRSCTAAMAVIGLCNLPRDR